MHQRTLVALASAATTAALLSTATVASAVDEEPTFANVYVALDLPDLGAGPMEFEAVDVLVGDGPELTGDNLIANPSEWCGDTAVDIDLAAQTITVTGGDEPCNFGEAYVAVELYGGTVLENVELTSDSLFGGDSWLAYYGVDDGVMDAYWSTCVASEPEPEPEPEPSPTSSPTSSPEPDEPVEDPCDWEYPNLTGSASFSFAVATDSEEPSTEVESEVEEADPATAVVSDANFTG